MDKKYIVLLTISFVMFLGNAMYQGGLDQLMEKIGGVGGVGLLVILGIWGLDKMMKA